MEETTEGNILRIHSWRKIAASRSSRVFSPNRNRNVFAEYSNCLLVSPSLSAIFRLAVLGVITSGCVGSEEKFTLSVGARKN